MVVFYTAPSSDRVERVRAAAVVGRAGSTASDGRIAGGPRRLAGAVGRTGACPAGRTVGPNSDARPRGRDRRRKAGAPSQSRRHRRRRLVPLVVWRERSDWGLPVGPCRARARGGTDGAAATHTIDINSGGLARHLPLARRRRGPGLEPLPLTESTVYTDNVVIQFASSATASVPSRTTESTASRTEAPPGDQWGAQWGVQHRVLPAGARGHNKFKSEDH